LAALWAAEGERGGLAHIGVLKVLEENGIHPDIITGTSIGSIIGALYASGLKAVEIERLVTRLDWKHLQMFADPALSLNGLIQGKRITALLESILGDLTFDDLVRDLTCVAADIQNGEPGLIREGPLVPAIRASISIPGVFVPAKIGGRYLVDGGLVLQVPVNVCREMGAEYVVAVNVVPDPARMMPDSGKTAEADAKDTGASNTVLSEETVLTPPEIPAERLVSHRQSIEKALGRFFRRPPLKQDRDRAAEGKTRERAGSSRAPTMLDVLTQCFTIVGYRIALEDMKNADLTINTAVETIGFWQFDRAEAAIAAGEKAARAALEKNKRIFPHAYAPKLEID
jgi:predicted acylesterase/phospholipase RssA